MNWFHKSQLDEEFANIFDLRSKFLAGLFIVGATKERSVFLYHGSATGRIDNDRIRFLRSGSAKTKSFKIGDGKLPGTFFTVIMIIQCTATSLHVWNPYFATIAL